MESVTEGNTQQQAQAGAAPQAGDGADFHFDTFVKQDNRWRHYASYGALAQEQALAEAAQLDKVDGIEGVRIMKVPSDEEAAKTRNIATVFWVSPHLSNTRAMSRKSSKRGGAARPGGAPANGGPDDEQADGAAPEGGAPDAGGEAAPQAQPAPTGAAAQIMQSQIMQSQAMKAVTNNPVANQVAAQAAAHPLAAKLIRKIALIAVVSTVLTIAAMIGAGQLQGFLGNTSSIFSTLVKKVTTVNPMIVWGVLAALLAFMFIRPKDFGIKPAPKKASGKGKGGGKKKKSSGKKKKKKKKKA